MKNCGYGIIITLIGASLWGVSGTSMQYLTVHVGLSPALVTLLRVFFAGILYAIYLVVFCRKTLREMFRKTSTTSCLVLFAFALYSNQLFYAETVRATNAGTATVLQLLECVFVLAFVCCWMKRLPYAREVGGVILAIVGTVLIATQGDITTLSMPLGGLVYGLLSAVASAAYILIPKQSRLFDRYGAIPVVGVGMVLAIAFAVPGYLVQGGSVSVVANALGTLTAFDWIVFLFGLVIVGTIVAFIAYLYGTSIVGPVKGALFAAVEPISATVMSALFLGTRFTGFDVAGMFVMCFMVVLLSGEEKGSAESSDGSSGKHAG